MDHFKFLKQVQSDHTVLTEDQWSAARSSAMEAMKARRNKFADKIRGMNETDRQMWTLPASLIAVFVFLWLSFLPESVLSFRQACIAGLIAMVGSVVVLLVIESKYVQTRRVLELTQPISEIESDICEEALKLCRESEQALAVRDAVVDAGAELRVFHFLEMRKLHKKDVELAEKAAEARRRQHACRELHGVV